MHDADPANLVHQCHPAVMQHFTSPKLRDGLLGLRSIASQPPDKDKNPLHVTTQMGQSKVTGRSVNSLLTNFSQNNSKFISENWQMITENPHSPSERLFRVKRVFASLARENYGEMYADHVLCARGLSSEGVLYAPVGYTPGSVPVFSWPGVAISAHWLEPIEKP